MPKTTRSPRKRGVPRYLKRRVVQFVITLILVSLAGPVIQWFTQGKVPLWMFITAMALPGVACGGISWWFGIAMRNVQRRAVEADCMICWDCGYGLAGLTKDGICPECGESYTQSELRVLWSHVPGQSGGRMTDNSKDTQSPESG